jgi:Flp pilus assembly protein CpaB
VSALSTFRGLTSRRPFTLLGILLALIVIAAFVLVALNAGTAGNVPTVSVVVATKDLQPRMPIDEASLQITRIPVATNYPMVFFKDASEVKGMIPLVTIVSGQAITRNEVVKASQALGSQSEYLPIPSGYVAVTIPTSEQQGVADYIQPDDYISVIAIVSFNGKVATKTIFTNVHVIKVGTSGAASGSASVTSLTIVVTECQAEVMAWFLQSAALKYTLESYQDYVHSTSTQAPDPKCLGVNSAEGQTLQSIQKAYPSLF